jgi:hypothetical protein
VVDVARFQGRDLMADLAGRDFTVNHARDHGARPTPSGRLRAVSDGASGTTCVAARPPGGRADLRSRRVPKGSSGSCSQIGEVSPGGRVELVKILFPAVAKPAAVGPAKLAGRGLPEVTALRAGPNRPPSLGCVEHTLQALAAWRYCALTLLFIPTCLFPTRP